MQSSTKRQSIPRIKQAITLFAIVIIAVYSATVGPDKLVLFKLIENWENDVRLAYSLKPEAQHESIVVVAINEDTLAQFPYRSPVDRAFISQLLQGLERQGARAILLDLLIDQPTEPEKDLELKQTVENLSVPLVISYTDRLLPRQLLYLNAFVPPDVRGMANVGKDATGMTRWIYPGKSVAGSYVPGVASVLASKIGVPEDQLPQQLVPIDWRGTPEGSNEPAFKSYKAHTMPKLMAVTSWFRDKIVLIGSEFDITDRHRTPFTLAPEFNAISNQIGTPGVYIHANNMAQILDQRQPPYMALYSKILLYFAASLIGIAVAFAGSKYFFSIGFAVVLLIGFWMSGFALYHYFSLLMPLATTTVSFFIAYLVTTLYIRQTAEKMKDFAEEETRVKSEFLANMSHEIRSPMNAIIGMTELVLESDLVESQRSRLRIVVNSAHSLLSLINDILDLSKLESGKMTMENMVFDLIQLVEETMATLEIQCAAKGLSLTLDIDPEIARCRVGDPLRLRQVIINLIGNAVKFTDEGGVTLVLTPSEDEAEQLLFAISDTGIGIPEDRQQAIFESFTQADGSTARKHGGTGLGTTISKQIVELMAGRIWLKSEVGVGSTFYFTAIIPEAQGVKDCRVDYGFGVKPSIQPRRQLQILLADDVEENLLLSRTRLEQQHHQVTTALNGLQVVQQWQSQPFDLILIDVQMPEMDGYDATREIRRREQQQTPSPRIPIVAMTASAMAGDRERCLAAGMDDYVSKPIDFSKLFNVIDHVVPSDAGIPLDPAIESDDHASADNRQTAEANSAHNPPLGDWVLSPDAINVERGMATWQNAATYQQALKSFAASHSGDSEQISDAIKTGDTAKAKLIAHSLKGVAANLAAAQLAESAEAIDHALNKGEPFSDMHNLIKTLDNHLENVISSIELAANSADMHSQDEQVSPERSEPLTHLQIEHLQTIKAAVEASDLELAERLIDQLKADSKDSIGLPLINSILSALNNFDFDEALAILENLINHIPVKQDFD